MKEHFKFSMKVVTGLMLVMVSVVLPAINNSAEAAPVNTAKMSGMFWEDQGEAGDKLMQELCNGGSRQEMVAAVKLLVQAESGLMAYGVNFNDVRLYSRQAKGLKPTDIERFAALVFIKRMSDVGFALQPAQSSFDGRRFDISRSGGSDSERIKF